MQLNTDLKQRVVMTHEDAIWRPSPAAGVERRMLFRDGEEQATATSVVRYAPGSSFPGHVHDGGEEYLVLDGVFSDDSGDHGKGTSVRNSVGSRHAPWTAEGATILVSLRQFQATDTDHVRIITQTAAWVPRLVDGLSVLPLPDHGAEHGTYEAGTWMRSPDGSRHAPWTETGALIYVKVGHLPTIGANQSLRSAA